MDNTGVELALSMESLSSSLEQGFDLYATADKIVDRVKASGQSVKEISVAQESVKFLQVLVGVSDNYDFATMNREDIISDPDYAYKLCLEEGEGILGGIWEGIKAVWNAIWGTITKFFKWFLGLFGVKFDESESATKDVKSVTGNDRSTIGDNIALPEGSIVLMRSMVKTKSGKQNYISAVPNLENYAKELEKYIIFTTSNTDVEYATKEEVINKVIKENFKDNDLLVLSELNEAAILNAAGAENDVIKRQIENAHARLKEAMGYESIKEELIKSGVGEGEVDKNIFVQMVAGDEIGFILINLVLYPVRVMKTAKEAEEENKGYYYTAKMKTFTMDLKKNMSKEDIENAEKEYKEKVEAAQNGLGKYQTFEQLIEKNNKDIKSLKSCNEYWEKVSKLIDQLVKSGKMDPNGAKAIIQAYKNGSTALVQYTNQTLKMEKELIDVYKKAITAASHKVSSHLSGAFKFFKPGKNQSSDKE